MCGYDPGVLIRPHHGLVRRLRVGIIRKVLAKLHAVQRMDLHPGPQAACKLHLALFGTHDIPPGFRGAIPESLLAPKHEPPLIFGLLPLHPITGFVEN